jgi:L-rhamnose-H+ transport protein
MTPNPFLGVFLHAIGGFAAGSFYAPLKQVRRWAWESFWLVMGLAAWLAAPWIVAWITTPDLLKVLAGSPAKAMWLAILFGSLWGLGNLTFGLSVRYLGMALGYAIALGFCMAFGTLVPPIYNGFRGTLQQYVGHRVPRVARHQRQDQGSGMGWHLDVDRVDHGDRLRQPSGRLVGFAL